MSRRGQISKRDVLPDPLYNSKLVTKLVNNIMYDGKKGVAQKIVYDAFAIIEPKLGQNPLEVFTEALENIMPVLEVKARRVGGSNYQVPMEVRPERRQTLGLRWLVAFSRTRGEKTMADRLAAEIMDAKNSTGGAFKKKEETHRMAEANKAFAHFRYRSVCHPYLPVFHCNRTIFHKQPTLERSNANRRFVIPQTAGSFIPLAPIRKGE